MYRSAINGDAERRQRWERSENLYKKLYNDAFTNHGTVLSFGAILARLDFVFSDKGPIHIIEQELSVSTQNKFSVIYFYNLAYPNNK